MKKIFLFSFVFSLMALTCISCGSKNSKGSVDEANVMDGFVPDERVLGDWSFDEVSFIPMLGKMWNTVDFNLDDKGNYVYVQKIVPDQGHSTIVKFKGKYAVEGDNVILTMKREDVEVEFIGGDYNTEEAYQTAVDNVLNPAFNGSSTRTEKYTIKQNSDGEIILVDVDNKKFHRPTTTFFDNIKGKWAKGNDSMQLNQDGTFSYNMSFKDEATNEHQFTVVFEGKYDRIWANAIEVPLSVDEYEMTINEEYYPDEDKRETLRQKMREIFFSDKPVVKRIFRYVDDNEGGYLDDSEDYLSDVPRVSYGGGWHKE